MSSQFKTFLLYCVVLPVCFDVAQITSAQETPRIRFTINDNWKFFPNDVSDAEKRKFRDADWQNISIPHTWNAADAFDDEPGYRRGPGWYRRELQLDPNLENKRIFLYFEGANHTADVYVNERHIGSHVGGYTAFAFDVTEFVGFDKTNLIAVKVDNTHDLEKPPINGDFTMYGGIYRDVWLIATEAVHFKITDHASPGVRVETPLVSNNSATVRISGTIVNAAGDAKVIDVASSIFDRENRRIASTDSKIRISAGSEANFEHELVQVTDPKLWSPDDPHLYRVRTVVRQNKKTLDEISSPLGFRWFRFDAEQGFLLNGKPLKLRGTNRHQDYAGLGNAVPDALQVRDLEIIKENGFNFLRLAHYPQDPSVLEAADRLGLLVWEEIPIVNQIQVSPVFNDHARRMLTEMIRQHRNHPSIIIWGYMNEVFLPVPKSEETVKATVALAKELEQICKNEDPARATAIAFDHGARELYHTSGLDSVTQIIGWNLYHGWYYETFEDFGKFLDEEHRRHPNRALIVSEYGANGDRRLHSREPKRFDSTIEWQRMYHEAYLPQINDRKYLAGSAVWNQFDFGSEFRGETIPHINQKGLFTYDRKPKDISYYYKASFSSQPVLHIATRDRQYRSGDLAQPIGIYTNLANVELFHNGVSLGAKTVDADNSVLWRVTLTEGKNEFLARSAATKENVSLFDSAKVYFTDYAGPIGISFSGIAVNVGSNAEFVDKSKTVWAADQPFKEGRWGNVGGVANAISTGRNVLGSSNDPLYQTILEDLSGYRFDVPDGDYQVELLFVEPQFKAPGHRIFDVTINGQMFLEKLDLAKEIGPMRAFRRKFAVSSAGKQGLTVEFVSQVGKPILSGIKITRA